MTFHSYLEYYSNLTKNDIQVQDKTKLMNIYNDTKKSCENLSNFELHSFILAWLVDAYEEKDNTIGPHFHMSLAYHNNTDDKIQEDLYADWFKEAAVRDYILGYKNKFNYEIKTLKQMNKLEIRYT